MTIAFQDYYETLGVNRAATQAEIQKAYRKLARQYHPDVNKEKSAEDKFKKINEAYEVLKNPQSRKKYDQLGNHWRSGEPFTPPSGKQDFGFDFGERFSEGTGFSSFFDMLFGDAGTIEQEATIEVTLEEAFQGVEKELLVKGLSGEQRRIQVRIPPGASEGSKIRLRGQGRSKFRGGKPGDLVLKIKLKPHTVFHVEKHDLVAKLKLSPWEAALGAKISVPTLSKAVSLSVPAGSQSGQRLRLKGKGLPRPKGEAGDIYYAIEIVVPKTLSAEERQYFEHLARVSTFSPRD